MHQNHLTFEVKAFSDENAKRLKGAGNLFITFGVSLNKKTQQTILCCYYSIWSEAHFQEKKKNSLKLPQRG